VKRSVAWYLVVLVVAVQNAVAAQNRTANGRPNVLFIAVDDLRPELGCYGTEGIVSPNIDRLAAGGLLFRRAYVQQAVCGPSRASFFSGQRPDSTGVHVNATHLSKSRPDIATLPQHFKSHGYRTVSLGKILHWPGDDAEAWSEPEWRPFNMGPSTREYLKEENTLIVRRLWGTQTLAGAKPPPPADTVKGPAYERMDVADNLYPDGLTADVAVAALKRLKDQPAPFFLAVGFIKPHLPFACPTRYWDFYDPRHIHLTEYDTPPVDMPAVAFVDSDEMRQYHAIPAEGPFDEDLARTLIHGYRACVSYTDAQVGRLLEALERLDLADETIVVLVGDHGWHLGEQGIWAKQTNFEIATRAPMIVRAPGRAAVGRTTDALVEFVDLVPTLCDLAGLAPPPDVEGTSFVPLLDDPARPWKRAAFSQYPRTKPSKAIGYSMRTDRYRLTRWLDAVDRDRVVAVELYDHATDPHERVNVAGSAANAELVRTLTEQLEAGWRAALPPE